MDNPQQAARRVKTPLRKELWHLKGNNVSFGLSYMLLFCDGAVYPVNAKDDLLAVTAVLLLYLQSAFHLVF